MIGVLFLVAFASSCGKVHQVFHPYPTDEVLIETLDRNRALFEEIIKLLNEDQGIRRIEMDGKVSSHDLTTLGLSEDRRQRYLSLMKAAGTLQLERWTWTENKETISFQMWWVPNGPLFGSKSKFLVYKDNTTKEYVASLDPIYASGGDANSSRRIDENWSIYLDVW